MSKQAAPFKALVLSVLAAIGAGASAAPICDRYCDGYDPSLASNDRVPVQASVWSRTVQLHFGDGDDMGWASIENGSPGDEVWLDRSFDGGRTWTNGSKLGDTKIPANARGWRTLMQNVDDWNDRGIGLLRACGKAGDRPDVACTPWARTTWNAGNPRTAAATALMEFYDQGTGLFDTTGWWNSANALTALIQNIHVTGMPSYGYAIGNTYDRNVKSGLGQFRNDYLDDTGWWGLAWVAAYDQTGDRRYLDTARADADYIATYHDDTCGGGVWWSTARTYKAAIANSLYLELNASLHNRLPGDTTYLQRARDEWTWFQGTGMIDAKTHLVHDGIDLSTCKSNNDTTWTYNQGVLVGGLAELYRATGDRQLLASAEQVADAATSSTYLNPNGVLTEPCEGGDCGSDGTSFKGPFVRGLAALDAALGQPRYASYLARQAQSAYSHDRDAQDAYGVHWAGPFDSADAARQQSALDLLNAAALPH